MADDSGAEAIRDKNRRIREEAAAKRRAKREGEKAARRPTLGQLEASEIMDDAFARTTHAVTTWVRRHFTIVQWTLVLALVGGIGWQVFVHHRAKVEGRTTDALFAGVTQEVARVGDEPAQEDAQTGLADPRPAHKTHAERLRAAEAAYKKVSEGDTARWLARLGLAGVLFDQGKHKEALAEYRAVKDGPLAQVDADARARATEGIGLSQEALGDRDGALKTFQELANSDAAALSALGLYHQGRLEHAKGNKDKAKTHLLAALKKLTDSKLEQEYVEQVSRELLASIDPTAVPPPSLSKEQREQLEQFQKMQKAAEQAKKAAEQATPTPKDVTSAQLENLMKQINEKVPPRAPAPAPSGSAP